MNENADIELYNSTINLLLLFIQMKIYISYSLNELIRSIHKDSRRALKERSWLVKCKRIGHDYYMYDIFFPKQKNVSAHTEFTGKPIDELIEYLWEERIEEFWEYCIRLHSHQKMNAFWSWEDRSTRKWFKDWGCPHFVSVVTSSTWWSNNCMWVFYHATLDVFDPINFEIDIKMELGLPNISVVEERPTEAYELYLKWVEQTQAHAQTLKDKFWFTDEEIETYLKTQEFRWAKTNTFYTEDWFMLDHKAKIEELAAVEEKITYPTYNFWVTPKTYRELSSYRTSKDTNNVFDYNDWKMYAPEEDNKGMVLFKRNKKWNITLDETQCPYYIAKDWEYYDLDFLTEYHELATWTKRDYRLAWNMWARIFYAPKVTKNKTSIIDELDFEQKEYERSQKDWLFKFP